MNELFDVRDGIQYDMHLHGSRFIVWEFIAAAVIETLVLLSTTNTMLRTPNWPWWFVPWLFLIAGVELNSVTIVFLALGIERKEGAHPPLPDHPHVEYYNWVLPVLVVTPLALPFLAWIQRNMRSRG